MKLFSQLPIPVLVFVSIVIAVLGVAQWSFNEQEKTALEASCDSKMDQERIQCFDEVFDTYLREKGVDTAFDYLLTIYNAYPEVPAVCHEWMHRLGEASYARYTNNGVIELREETAYCSYGYFHGFIGMMASQAGLQAGREFCEQITHDGDTQKQLQFNNCIHGMGHSVATLMLESDESWGNAQKIIENGARACEDIYTDLTLRRICYDGLFHELHLALWSEDYGLTNELSTQHDDLFYYCRSLNGPLLESCLYDFIALWPYVYGDDKKKTMSAVLTAVSGLEEYMQKPMKNLGRSFIEADITSHEYSGSVSACEMVPTFLYRACIEGLATGFVEHGKSGEMHEEGFVLCRTYFEGEKQNMCFELMLEALAWDYTAEQMIHACDALSSSERPEVCDRHKL